MNALTAGLTSMAAACLLTVAAAAAETPRDTAHQAPDGELQTRVLLDLQRNTKRPPQGMTAEEVKRILKNYLDSIGKGGGGAPLPDDSSVSGD